MHKKLKKDALDSIRFDSREPRKEADIVGTRTVKERRERREGAGWERQETSRAERLVQRRACRQRAALEAAATRTRTGASRERACRATGRHANKAVGLLRAVLCVKSAAAAGGTGAVEQQSTDSHWQQSRAEQRK